MSSKLVLNQFSTPTSIGSSCSCALRIVSSLMKHYWIPFTILNCFGVWFSLRIRCFVCIFIFTFRKGKPLQANESCEFDVFIQITFLLWTVLC
ncbi:uncharacterized protein DS421_16g547010 [Arachis hypogaea]|nr:uncharacterized protein DS421_16g547010 [Arachis hypogaea]